MQTIFLQVKPVLNGQNIQLQLCHGTVCGNANGNYPDVSLAQNSGPAVFIVSIADPSQGVKFANDALWMHGVHGSPNKQGLNNNGQVASFTKANDTTIFFTDPNNNTSPMNLGYSLHFTGPNGQSIAIDPDIKNGGGTTYYSNVLQVGAVILGAATLLAILYVAFQQSAVRRSVEAIRAALGKV